MQRLLQLLATCAVVYSALLTATSAASECKPVAYLFRHAEDINKDKQSPFDVTLSTSGQAHAQLYIEMIREFQLEKPDYCPINVVYALNPVNFDEATGTSNPYWTANPLAQMVQTNLDDSTQEDTNPIITVHGMKLTEYLNHGEAEHFVEHVKTTLNNQHSVAIFWTSQGMCEVAIKLGLPGLPGFTCAGSSKPPRNSVFRLNYSVTTHLFTDVTSKYAQCFNYDANSDSFTNNVYHCQFSYNLNDWEGPEHPGFLSNLQEISGRICDRNNPAENCKVQ